MNPFPRTMIEKISVPRMIIGTNWFFGYSHFTKAKDRHIVETMTSKRIADILEVFLKAGVDALYGIRPDAKIIDAVKEAEQRTGRKMIHIAIPSLSIARDASAESENARTLDEYAKLGVKICMPHQGTTDAFLDKRTKSLAGIEKMLAMIRERGMVPGLSTHRPETISYADTTGIDVATYIQIYNAAEFMMCVEVDWVQRGIWNAKKPVIVIKPLAAGRLHPLVGLAFVWSTIRDKDMVCVGTSSPHEVQELIDMSWSLLTRTAIQVELQETRSKASMKVK